MEKVTLYAQVIDTEPRILRKSLTSGVLEAYKPFKSPFSRFIHFTSVGDTIWKTLKRKDNNTQISVVEYNNWGTQGNWTLSMKVKSVNVILQCVQYYFAELPYCLALKIEIEGEPESVSKLVNELLTSSETPPYDFKKWDKFEVKFGVTKKECIAAWEKYRQ